MIRHLNIRIYGKVQGVGFRWATMKKAQNFSIAGFVKNEPNGSLYIEAEGEEQNLQKFIAWCRKGPLWAKVTTSEVTSDMLKHFSSFEIIG